MGDLFTSKNIGAVVNKVSDMARMYYEESEEYDGDSGGGLIGLIGMLVVGGLLLLFLFTILPAIAALCIALFTGGGLFNTGVAFPIATLAANGPGRRKRRALPGIHSKFSFQEALSTLEKAYKAYTSK